MQVHIKEISDSIHNYVMIKQDGMSWLSTCPPDGGGVVDWL